MKLLIIPDVHLKPAMVEEAAGLLRRFRAAEKKAEGEPSEYVAVFLGDLADDWEQFLNIGLYERTYDVVSAFAKEFPDTYFCCGNHDMSYLWHKLESGYSVYAESVVQRRMYLDLMHVFDENHWGYVFRIGNVIVSHGGLLKRFVNTYLAAQKKEGVDAVIEEINHGMHASDLWNDLSPLWARPQYTRDSMYPQGCLQVVGHTPVEGPIYDEKRELLSVDTFSTDASGEPVGTPKFVLADSDTKAWEFAEDALGGLSSLA